MDKIAHLIARRLGPASMPIAAWIFVAALLLPTGASAKTPDGVPPSQETVCSGLQGAAFGLCNAYCEAQDCDVHPRPSCARLLANFRRLTGMPAFPCDVACGNGMIDPGEPCDPSAPVNPCPCLDDCTCEMLGSTCCECVDLDGNLTCTEVTGTSGCPIDCTLGPPGSECSDLTLRCVVPQVCCECDMGCFQGLPTQCELQGCIPVLLPGSTCTPDGCVAIGGGG